LFQTVRQAARYLEVPEHLIRSMVAQGECPGIYSGNRFLVHVEALREYLDTASRSSKEAVRHE
jgi:excisionase family DNA binding protein